MELLIIGDGSLEVVTPEEMRVAIGILLENNEKLPEFVTEVVTLETDFNIRICADIYAKHHRLNRKYLSSRPSVSMEDINLVDAVIIFGGDKYGVCPMAVSLDKACLVLPYPQLPTLGIQGINPDGTKTPLTMEELDSDKQI